MGAPANQILAGILFVVTHQRQRPAVVVIVGDFHRAAKQHAVAFGLAGRIDHAGSSHALGEMAQLAVDLAQFLAAIDIIAVLAAIAIAGGPAHHLDNRRSVGVEQLLVPGAQGRHAGGGDGVAVHARWID
jgi:hypothetical protein